MAIQAKISQGPISFRPVATGMACSIFALLAGPSVAYAQTASNTASVAMPSGSFDTNTANNDSTDTDTVYAAIVATNDSATGINGAAGATAVVNAFTADTINGVAASPSNATLSAVGTVPAGLTFDTATGNVDVAAGTPAGTYTFDYQICETLNPTNCQTATISVTVVAAPIVATDDSAQPVSTGIGVANAVNVLTNDTLNGQPVTPETVTLTLVGASHPGITLDPATGNVSISPDVPEGNHTLTYRICEQLNPTNCTEATVQFTILAAKGAISGTVYDDADSDRVVDADESRRANWIVEIVRNGEVVATARTDAEGNYEVEDLDSGSGYEIRFRNPENNVVFDIISNVTVGNGTTVADQNQPIDPSGVIFNSVTRAPVSGATITLVDRNGTALPTICYIDASQSSQVTGASGEYRFDLVPGAAPACPAGESEYHVRVTPPSGYADSSSVLAPLDGPLDPTGRGNPYRVSPNAEPAASGDVPYYLDFRLATGDPDVIFNHIPLDPFLSRTPLVVTKTSIKRSASVGDIVPYEITVRNTENVQRTGVTVVDILPSGMKYILGTGIANGVAAEPQVSDRQLNWANQTIPANGSVKYNLTLVIGAGVTGGEKVNTGLARNGADGVDISNRGTAVISVVPSSVFDCSELIGKVFEDINRNGYQDEGEPGLPGARLATVNGQLVTTDAEGRYHIACAAVPDARIGSNFVLKLDPRTLPLGWDITTDNPRSIRLTRGKFGELNFGVAPPVEAENPPSLPKKGGE